MECDKKCFMSNLLDYALDTYRSHFQRHPDFAAFAPGRVNLIGDHTDYNNGFVLPIALPLGTIFAGAKNGSSQVHIISTSSQIGEKNVVFNLPERGKVEKEPVKWVNYVKGVIAFFEGEVTEGFNAVVVSSVPVGGGLSSSAALEVSTYVFLEALFENHYSSLREKVLRCQEAEHLYADMPCGIMDQFISIMAEYGKALLLDCRSLKTTLVPFKTVEEVVVVTNSNVKHELSSSEYPLRRKQCEEAAYLLGVESLRDVDLRTLEEYKTRLPVVIYKRARHVVTENARTVAAAEALKKNDFITFGKLMIESHNSLRDDFEVSCRELNQLVDIAISVDGVYGSRMTGGGFGGCTVSLVMECEKKCLLPNLLRLAIETFKAHFSADPMVAAFAPGRVNLIGEHTDYNDGFVLPIALPMGTVIAGALNNSSKVRVRSLSHLIGDNVEVEFELPESGKVDKEKVKWVNYVKGVIAFFKGGVKDGFNAVIVSSVPVGGGLSSSAALEVSTYFFLEALTGQYNKDLKDKALRCQKAEHLYADMPCGIMDQFVSIMAKHGQALLLDCRSMQTTNVPFNAAQEVVLVTNSNVKHELSSSEYPVRRKQCEEAARILGVKSLRDVKLETLLKFKPQLPPINFKRAHHVVTEIERTTGAAEALKKNDFVTFGKLMIKSHESLRDHYEVSCPELDQLVDLAVSIKGVYGSRMTGGGFGGCTVTLVKQDAVELVIRNIKNKYSGNPTFYIASPAEGASVLNIKSELCSYKYI